MPSEKPPTWTRIDWIKHTGLDELPFVRRIVEDLWTHIQALGRCPGVHYEYEAPFLQQIVARKILDAIELQEIELTIVSKRRFVVTASAIRAQHDA